MLNWPSCSHPVIQWVTSEFFCDRTCITLLLCIDAVIGYSSDQHWCPVCQLDLTLVNTMCVAGAGAYILSVIWPLRCHMLGTIRKWLKNILFDWMNHTRACKWIKCITNKKKHIILRIPLLLHHYIWFEPIIMKKRQEESIYGQSPVSAVVVSI